MAKSSTFRLEMIKLLISTLIFCFFAGINPADVYAGADLDQTPPTCTITYDPSSIPPPLGSNMNTIVTADDAQTGGSGISLVNLFSPAGTLIATSTSSPLSYTWATSPGTYTFSATATDTIGNTNPSCLNSQTFTVGNIDAWIQTTGGDVHSNTGINTPGGP